MDNKKIFFGLLLTASLFADNIDSAFGYTVNTELTDKNLKIVEQDDQETVYKLDHKPVGDLTNFYLTANTHGKQIISSIEAKSMVIQKKECNDKIGSLRSALKEKYGTSRISTNTNRLGAECKTAYNKDRNRILGSKLRFYVKSMDALTYSREVWNEWRIKKATTGDASKYKGF